MGIQVHRLTRPLTANKVYELFAIPRAMLGEWRSDPEDSFPFAQTVGRNPNMTMFTYELQACCERRLDGGDPEQWREMYPQNWEASYERA